MTWLKDRWPLLLVLLACLAAWGSRERTWTQHIETLTTENKNLTTSLSRVKMERDEFKRSSETAEDVEPVLLPDGTVAYATHRTSRTVETAMHESQDQIEKLTKELSELKSKSVSTTTETVKSAPMWNAVVGWDPLNAAYYAGAGVNLGPLSLDLDNPVALDFRPRLTGMIRF